MKLSHFTEIISIGELPIIGILFVAKETTNKNIFLCYLVRIIHLRGWKDMTFFKVFALAFFFSFSRSDVGFLHTYKK